MKYTEEGKLTDADLRYDRRYVWTCAVGGKEYVVVPPGGDAPMRRAVERAFYELTGERPAECFSGWGEKFTEEALAVIENREPNVPPKRTLAPMWCVYAAFVVGLVGGYIAGAY